MRERDEMANQELDQAQETLEPKEDLAPYAGQWVALREGRVVASDLDPMLLREQDEVEEDDVVLPVAHAEPGYFIA